MPPENNDITEDIASTSCRRFFAQRLVLGLTLVLLGSAMCYSLVSQHRVIASRGLHAVFDAWHQEAFVQMALFALLALTTVGGLFVYQRRQLEFVRSGKLAEAAVERSHETLLTILNSMDAIVYVADMETYELLFANKQVEHLFGAIVGQPCWNTIQAGQTGPCTFCSNDKLLDAAGNPGETYNWEFHNTANGHWYDVRDRAFQWVDGRVVRMQIATDITGRKRQEEALTERERFIESIINLSSDLLYVYDLVDQRNVYTNESINRILGYSKQEVKEMGDGLVSLLMHPDDLTYYLEETVPGYARIKDNESHTTRYRMKHKNGEWRWLFCNELIYMRDSDGFPRQIFGMVRDITEQKKAEEARQEANQFSEQVINSAQEGVIVYDRDFRYRVWNPFMEQITGLAAGDVLGRHPSELFPFTMASGLIESLEKVSAGGVSVKMDFPYSVPLSGNSGWASDQMSPLRNSNGDIVGVISTVREISLRKQLDDELRQALDAANNANSTMGRLLRTIAHEFRTPLGLLVGSADILDRYWERLTPERRLEQNECIRNASSQLGVLVNSVVLFNQSEIDKSDNHIVLQDLGQTCHMIAVEVETVWSSGHKYTVTIAADCGSALLDKSLLRRILENLLTNAFRYTPSDGAVSLHVSREGALLSLEVADTGIGIPEEDQGLVFDAFYRSRNVEWRRGLGLGLSIVSEALSQLGGTIKVNSIVSEGTTMLVEIPVDDPA